ncbi:hypothetical protein [Neosynechococcus sphagnicola]|uniref:hypothetical protein n=1 Tax=Neosynechococcus sphagnicola TaxID=1501145 RepID=UPI000A50C1EA
MQIPRFSECHHPLVKSLSHLGDQELLSLFQDHAEDGLYFTGIFCRYSLIVYSLVRHQARSPVQADYLFALTWRHIFHELRGLKLTGGSDGDEPALTLQNWLINMTAVCINQTAVTPR